MQGSSCIRAGRPNREVPGRQCYRRHELRCVKTFHYRCRERTGHKHEQTASHHRSGQRERDVRTASNVNGSPRHYNCTNMYFERHPASRRVPLRCSSSYPTRKLLLLTSGECLPRNWSSNMLPTTAIAMLLRRLGEIRKHETLIHTPPRCYASLKVACLGQHIPAPQCYSCGAVLPCVSRGGSASITPPNTLRADRERPHRKRVVSDPGRQTPGMYLVCGNQSEKN